MGKRMTKRAGLSKKQDTDQSLDGLSRPVANEKRRKGIKRE